LVYIGDGTYSAGRSGAGPAPHAAPCANFPTMPTYPPVFKTRVSLTELMYAERRTEAREPKQKLTRTN